MKSVLLSLVALLWRVVTAQPAVYSIPLQYAGLDTNTSLGEVPHGKPGQGYYITLNVGTPPQKLNVLVDTGSSNFAIAASPDSLITKYFISNRSSTFVPSQTHVQVPYTQGKWQGFLGRDSVSFSDAPQLSLTADFTCINQSDKFFINGSNWQGILGLAYVAIERPDASIVPFFDSLVTSQHISNQFSLQLCGTMGYRRRSRLTAGSLTVGGFDSTLFTGELLFTPVWMEWYYEVVVTNIVVGDKKMDIDCQQFNNDKTIVDSGTTNLRLPQPVFKLLVASMKEQVLLDEVIPEDFWLGAKSICWLSENIPWKVFPHIHIHLAHSLNTSFALSIPPQQYLRDVEETDMREGHTCYKFAVSSSESGTVLGAVVLEGFYLVFDRVHKRIGFAKSVCDNNEHVRITGPFVSGDPMKCAHPTINAVANTALKVVAYTMGLVCVVCTIPLAVALFQWAWQRRKMTVAEEHGDGQGLVEEETTPRE